MLINNDSITLMPKVLNQLAGNLGYYKDLQTHQNHSINLLETFMLICFQKIKFITHFFLKWIANWFSCDSYKLYLTLILKTQFLICINLSQQYISLKTFHIVSSFCSWCCVEILLCTTFIMLNNFMAHLFG